MPKKGIELASAYVTLLPSLDGAQKKIEAELADVDAGSIGEKIGEKLSEGVSEGLGESAEGLDGLGDKSSDVLGDIARYAPIAGAAVAAIGAAAFAAASDFDEAGARIEAAVGDDVEAAERLKGVGRTLYEDGWGESMTQLSDSLVTAREVLGDLSETDMTYAVEGAMTLEQVYGSDLSETLRGTRVLMERFGLSAEEATDLMVAGTQRGLDYTGELGDNLSEYAGRWADAGLEASEYFSLLEAGADSGAYSLDKVGDFLNEFLTSLSDGRMEEGIGRFSEGTQEVFESFKDGGATAQDVLNAVIGELATMPDEYSKAQIASELWSSLGEDNAMSMIEALADVEDSFGDVSGAAEDASEALSDSLGSKATSALRKWQDLLLPVGELAVDAFGMAADAATWVADCIDDLTGGYMETAEQQLALASATRSASDIMSSAMDDAGAAADEYGRKVGEAMQEVGESTSTTVASLAELSDEAEETLAGLYTQGDLLDRYVETIGELAGKSDLTRVEQQLLAEAVEGYNEITGDSVEVTDAANGTLSEGTDEIRENAEAWRENAEAQAYQQLATRYLEEQLSAQRELQSAQDELMAAREHYDQLVESGASNWEITAAAAEVGSLEQSVDELGDAVGAASDNYEAFSAEALLATSELSEGMKDAVTELPEYMQVAGVDIAESLSAGIESGSVSADDAAWYLSTAVEQQVSRLPASLRDDGMAAALGLAESISSGQITAQQAAQVLEAVVSGEVGSLPPELQELGAQAASNLAYSLGSGQSLAAEQSGDLATAAALAVAGLPEKMGLAGSDASAGFAGGILGGRGATASAAGQVADAASGMGDVGNTYGWGYELGANFARGLGASAGRVASAAAGVAGEAWAYLHHSTPERGPLADDDKWGGELVENFAEGMLGGIPALRSAAGDVAGAAAFGATGSYAPYGGGAGAGSTYNVYIDGDMLASDSRIRESVLALVELIARRKGMGEVTA